MPASGGSTINDAWRPSMHRSVVRNVVNESFCLICEQSYLKGSCDFGICGRPMCRQVYARTQHSPHFRAIRRRRLPRRPYQVNWIN